MANVLDKLPKRLRPRAKRALRDIMYAETKTDAAHVAVEGEPERKRLMALLEDG